MGELLQGAVNVFKVAEAPIILSPKLPGVLVHRFVGPFLQQNSNSIFQLSQSPGSVRVVSGQPALST